jgi:hypothetical protein
VDVVSLGDLAPTKRQFSRIDLIGRLLGAQKRKERVRRAYAKRHAARGAGPPLNSTL